MSNLKENFSDENLKYLIGQSILQPQDSDFEDKLMKRITLISKQAATKKKNIYLSWLFLALSVLLFPIFYFPLDNSLQTIEFQIFNIHVKGLSDILFPTGIIIFSIMVLLHFDNLLKLTFKNRMRTF